MKKIEVVVFDLGNVLLPFDYSPAVKRMNDAQHGAGDNVQKYLKDNYHFFREFEAGKILPDEYLDKIFTDNELTFPKEDFCKYYSEIFIENTPLTSLLPEIRKRFQLILLSNTNEIHKKYGWEKYGFISNFEKLILSHEVKAVKPEPAIYQAVMDYTKKAPESHIFIDDIFDYTMGAKAMGWDAIHCTDNQVVIDGLHLRGII